MQGYRVLFMRLTAHLRECMEPQMNADGHG